MIKTLTATAALLAILLPSDADSWRIGLAIFAITFPAGQIAAWWLDLIHIAARTMRRRRLRVEALGLAVPILWYVLAAIIFVGVPLIVLYVLLIAITLF